MSIYKRHWENKRKCIINIIKAAYEQNLIGSKPTGQKYQATIRAVKPKLIDNYNHWTEEEKRNFSLHKKTTVTRGEIIMAEKVSIPFNVNDEKMSNREEKAKSKQRGKK